MTSFGGGGEGVGCEPVEGEGMRGRSQTHACASLSFLGPRHSGNQYVGTKAPNLRAWRAWLAAFGL